MAHDPQELPAQKAPAPQDGGGAFLALRASLACLLVSALILLAAWLLLPERLLATSDQGYLLAGGLLAMVTGSLGNLMLSLAACLSPEDSRGAQVFLRAVVLDFALQVFSIVLVLVGMFLLEVKFPRLATFGISFAVVATVFRILGSLLITRRLNQRARQRAQASSC